MCAHCYQARKIRAGEPRWLLRRRIYANNHWKLVWILSARPDCARAGTAGPGRQRALDSLCVIRLLLTSGNPTPIRQVSKSGIKYLTLYNQIIINLKEDMHYFKS